MLIKAEAIGVNFLDTYFRSGQYPREVPFIVGSEVCGTVEALGDDVAALKVGDRVVTAEANGGYAEYCVAPADLVAYVPEGVDADAAAASLLKGMTAHYLIKSVYPVQQGDTVLLHAGAGGVGLILTQWVTSLAARVITTVSTPQKASCPGRPARWKCSTIRRTRRSSVPRSASSPTATGSPRCTTGSARRRRRQHGQPGDPRHAGAVRVLQRARPAVDPQRLNAAGSLFLTRPTLVHYTAHPTSSPGAPVNCSSIAAGTINVTVGGVIRWPMPRRRTATCKAARPSARWC